MENDLKDLKGLITSHYIKYWGLPNNIIRMEPIQDYEWALMIFRDKEVDGLWIASNGIYLHNWPGKKRDFGLELCVYIKNHESFHYASWLLALLFKYMLDKNIPLHVFETINGGDLRTKGLPYDDLMILEPYNADSGLGGQLTGWPKPFLLNQIIGLHAKEKLEAIRIGSEIVFDEITDEAGVDLRFPIDVVRRSSIKIS